MALNKQTLAEQIYAILRDDILTQKIKCGEKLTLKVLMERFQVSSTPIREALTRLVQDQLITYYSNVGVRVIDPSPDEIREIYTFMGDLDALAIKYASSYADQHAIIMSVKKLLSDASAALSSGDSIRWNELSDAFHLEFYRFCQNKHLTDSAERLRSRLSIFSKQYGMDPAIQLPIQKSHEEIFKQYSMGKIDEAAELMRAHLKSSLGYALKLASLTD